MKWHWCWQFKQSWRFINLICTIFNHPATMFLKKMNRSCSLLILHFVYDQVLISSRRKWLNSYRFVIWMNQIGNLKRSYVTIWDPPFPEKWPLGEIRIDTGTTGTFEQRDPSLPSLSKLLSKNHLDNRCALHWGCRRRIHLWLRDERGLFLALLN